MTKIEPALNRGVAVDEEGYFLAALQWGEVAPRFPRKPPRGTPRIILLTEPEALDPPSEKARWDFTAKAWELPTTKMWIVNERGEMKQQGLFWVERPPQINPGWMVVTTEPPLAVGAKPVWDGVEWVAPRRVAILDETGEIVNIVVENPRGDVEDVTIPEGWTRFDDREKWPTGPDGTPVGVGWRRGLDDWEDVARARALVAQRQSTSLSPAEFADAAVEQGWITESEADSWISRNGLPEIAIQAISSFPQQEQRRARFDTISATEVPRNSPMVLAMQEILSVSDEVMDEVFGLK